MRWGRRSGGAPDTARPRLASAETVRALLRRPDLWPTALRLGLATTPPGWWRHWPPVPRPPAPYLAFRLQTMYGDRAGAMPGADAIGYLEWCRRMRRLAR